ncbi:MAG: GtrA family protein, partial [Candidatus Mcinerneyibacterium aminivorans]
MVKKFAKFVLTNISGTIIDTVALWLMKSYIFSSYFGVYIISPIIGFEIAML